MIPFSQRLFFWAPGGYAALLPLTLLCCEPMNFDTMFEDDCYSDDECGRAQICRIEMFGNDCADADICGTNVDCAPELECRLRNGDTEATTRTTCEARRCSADVECPAGNFVCDGNCTPRRLCEADAECGGERICRVRTTVAARGAVRRTCEHPTCKTDHECAPGEVCGGGTTDTALCAPENTCDSHVECDEDQLCRLRASEVIAVTRTTCEGCEHDVDCPDGKICANPFGTPGCLEIRLCETDEDCPDGQQCSHYDGLPIDPELDRKHCW